MFLPCIRTSPMRRVSLHAPKCWPPDKPKIHQHMISPLSLLPFLERTTLYLEISTTFRSMAQPWGLVWLLHMPICSWLNLRVPFFPVPPPWNLWFGGDILMTYLFFGHMERGHLKSSLMTWILLTLQLNFHQSGPIHKFIFLMYLSA